MNGEGRGVDRFITNDNIALLVHENEVRHGYLREVLGERVEPEVVGQDGIADRDVAGNSFVETCTASCQHEDDDTWSCQARRRSVSQEGFECS